MVGIMLGVSQFFLTLVSVLNLGAASHRLQRDEGDTSLGRMPTDLYPLHYNIELQADFYTGTPPFLFNGSVSIRFECEVATNIVYLNSDGLNIESVNINVANDSPVAAPQPVYVKHELDDTLLFLKIFLDDYLFPGAEYVVDVEFAGTMKDPSDQDGLYWTSYVSVVDGATHYTASTQFQPHGARQTFPCFDEPLFKATYDVTLWRNVDVIALSNGPLFSTEDMGGGWIADTFNTTQNMSVYLVCFTIGEFDYLESFTSSGTPVRTYGRPEYVQELTHANNLAAAMQDWLETWTGLVDPMAKVDHIAVPGKVGAMENWGLVTYSETLLMHNSSADYLYQYRETGSVIGHELAHFWFGDLVTCRWWTDSWLNEGFASFFQDLPFDDVFGVNPDVQAILMRLRHVMVSDSKEDAQPVRYEVDSPWHAGDGFGDFTYDKGSGMLRMVRQFLGDDTFQKGIQRYLNSHAHGTVVTDDLWDALTEQSEIDGVTDTGGLKLFVKEKMDPWVGQIGYPLITFTRTGAGTADVTQSHFLSPLEQDPPSSPYLYEWYVPLTISNQETQSWSNETTDWINREASKSITSGIPDGTDQWFVANVDQSGFYRVKYDTASYMLIVDQLAVDISPIPSLNRYAILNDAIEIARSGLELETFAMEATRFLWQEETLVVWETAQIGLAYPALVLDRYPDTYGLFQKYMRTKVDPVYASFGWDNGDDAVLRQGARAVVLDMACTFGNPDCQSESRVRFDELVANPGVNSIPPDQRLTVYCTSIALGTEGDWDFLHSLYLSIADSVLRSAPAEIDRLLMSLACSLDDQLLQRYINYTFEPGNVRSGDVRLAIDAISASPRGRWVMWDILQANWNSNPVPNGASKTNALISVTEGFATADDIAELEIFIATYPPVDDTESAAYDTARTTSNNNKLWADSNEAVLNTWCRDHINSTSTRGSVSLSSGHKSGYSGAARRSLSLRNLLLKTEASRLRWK